MLRFASADGRNLKVEEVSVQDQIKLPQWNALAQQRKQPGELRIWLKPAMPVGHPQLFAVACLPQVQLGQGHDMSLRHVGPHGSCMGSPAIENHAPRTQIPKCAPLCLGSIELGKERSDSRCVRCDSCDTSAQADPAITQRVAKACFQWSHRGVACAALSGWRSQGCRLCVHFKLTKGKTA